MSDSPQYPGGYQFPEEPEPVGGYEPPPRPEPPRPDPPSETTVEPVEDPEDAPAAAERFRRTTRARRRTIRAQRGKGHWRLLTWTPTYVMVVGGIADYVEPETRTLAHLVFWALTGIGLLVTVERERRHGWSPAPRWPWLAGALGGALAVELLVLTVGSPGIIVGSVILLGLGLFVLMLVG